MGFELNVTLPDGRRFTDAQKGLNAFARVMDQAISAREFSRAVQYKFINYLDTVALSMRQRHSVQWDPNLPTLPSGPGQGRMAVRSGALMQAIEESVRVQPSGDVVVGTIGGGITLPYAAIHEFGGKVKAKKAYLTIPTQFALDSKGVPLKRKARDWPNTFVQKSKKGNLLIFQKRGRTIVPLYVLVKEVTIPPRLGLLETVEESLPRFVETMFTEMVADINRKIKRARGN